MKCWICGDDANSGEHMIKASDLKSLFGHVTQMAPLYFHTDEKRNQPVAGIKSDKNSSIQHSSVSTATMSARNRMTELGRNSLCLEGICSF